MYFDPLSAWIVTLIADGLVISSERCRGGYVREYDRKQIAQSNEILNASIDRIKNKYGVSLPEMAYKEVQLQIKVTMNSTFFKRAGGAIFITPDNQEYIISLLDGCAKQYSGYEYDEAQEKFEFYHSAAIQARTIKKRLEKERKEVQIRQAKELANEQTMSNIYLIIGLIIIVFFLLFLFSL